MGRRAYDSTGVKMRRESILVLTSNVNCVLLQKGLDNRLIPGIEYGACELCLPLTFTSAWYLRRVWITRRFPFQVAQTIAELFCHLTLNR
jgi:hypothetical protein